MSPAGPENRQLRHIFMPAKSLEELLNTNKDAELGELLRRAREFDDAFKTLSKALPDDLASGLLAVSIRDPNELVALARSSAWASRLRFEQAQLLDTARSAGINVDSVSVRVARVDYNNRG